eukprot:15339461-Ditylum_brightwellii.AAC.1
MEKAIKSVVLQGCICIWQPNRCEMEEHSHPCTICNYPCREEEGYIHVGFWSLAGPSCQEDLVVWGVRGLFHVCARQDQKCACRFM